MNAATAGEARVWFAMAVACSHLKYVALDKENKEKRCLHLSVLFPPNERAPDGLAPKCEIERCPLLKG